MDQRKSTLNIALEVIDEGIIRLARQLYVKGVALTEFESNGVASAHTRKLLREGKADTLPSTIPSPSPSPCQRHGVDEGDGSSSKIWLATTGI